MLCTIAFEGAVSDFHAGIFINDYCAADYIRSVYESHVLDDHVSFPYEEYPSNATGINDMSVAVDNRIFKHGQSMLV